MQAIKSIFFVLVLVSTLNANAQSYNPFQKRTQSSEGFTGSSSALSGDGTSMSPVLIAAEQIRQIVETQNLEIVHMQFDIIRDEHEISRYITDGFNYKVIAFADDRIEDLDLTAYRYNGSSWVEVKKDTDAKAICVIDLPRIAAEYRFKMKAYKKRSGYDGGHFGIMICHTK